MMRRHWTPADLELLEILYPELPTEAVAWELGRTARGVFAAANARGLHKSREYLQSAEGPGVKADTGAKYRFRPGHVPANKGVRMPGYAPGRMAETQFKHGEMSGAARAKWKPVGTIMAVDGYLRIKIRERVNGKPAGWDKRVWPLVHWRVWEKHHGRRVPKGHKVVFRDGNRANCDIGNLELLTNAEMMRRNSVHNLPAELAQVIQLNGALKRKIRRLTKNGEEQNARSARPPVRATGAPEGQRPAAGG
jgi:hypothetical protein